MFVSDDAFETLSDKNTKNSDVTNDIDFANTAERRQETQFSERTVTVPLVST